MATFETCIGATLRFTKRVIEFDMGGLSLGNSLGKAQKQAPKQKPKPAKFNTRAGRRRVHSRSLLGTNKAPDDGWAEWGTTASDAYDSAHEAHQAAAFPERDLAVWRWRIFFELSTCGV